MATSKEPASPKREEGTTSRDIEKLLNIYIETAEDLITQCQGLKLKDAKKLEKKCSSELKYLQSDLKKLHSTFCSDDLSDRPIKMQPSISGNIVLMIKPDDSVEVNRTDSRMGFLQILHALKKRRQDVKDYDIKVQEHDLKSSNLSHFSAILHAVQNLPGVTKILSPFSTKQRSDSLVVDIVAQNGRMWVKVIARKAQALHLIWAGKGQYGDRDIVRQAEGYVKCASEHPINFTSPEVHYSFYNEVTEPMASALEAVGVKVWGKRIPVAPEMEFLISTNDIDSDEDFENENSDFDEIDNEANDDDDGVLNIPSASEFSSFKKKNNEKSKQFDNIQFKNEDFQNKNSVLSEINSSNTEVNLSNDLSAGLSIDNDSSSGCHSKPKVATSGSGGMKPLLLESEEIFTSILGSAPVYTFPESKEFDKSLPESSMVLDVYKVNLDITTMITLVSSITHGGCNFTFKEKILSQQAKEERESPVLPELHKYLKDKDWYVCQTAVDDFLTILDTLGGENEKQRAEELLKKCKIVPDQPSSRAQKLPESGKIRDRSKTIFGTGDQLKCVTVSANSGFVRAAEHQGVVFAVYLHQSRALTEKKEKCAEPLVE